MKDDANRQIKDTLAKHHACYILITCDHPSENGEMNVEMSYKGDLATASYLLEGAQCYMRGEDPSCPATIEDKSSKLSKIVELP